MQTALNSGRALFPCTDRIADYFGFYQTNGAYICSTCIQSTYRKQRKNTPQNGTMPNAKSIHSDSLKTGRRGRRRAISLLWTKKVVFPPLNLKMLRMSVWNSLPSLFFFFFFFESQKCQGLQSVLVQCRCAVQSPKWHDLLNPGNNSGYISNDMWTAVNDSCAPVSQNAILV